MSELSDRLLLTPAQAGELLGVSGRTVERMIASGEIVAARFPGRRGRWISGEWLREWAKRRPIEQAAETRAERTERERAMDGLIAHRRKGGGRKGGRDAKAERKRASAPELRPGVAA